ncbi:MAG: DNA recombination protein RmuC [Thermodesulfobacteriota bacterium]
MLVFILLLLFVLLWLILKTRAIDPKDVQNAVSSSWIDLRLSEKIGAIEIHAKEIKESYKSFEQMLRVPIQRASFGELALETILSEQLPQGMYGIRQRTLDGKIPDAYVKSSVGIICIDSKFPLDNYRRMAEAIKPEEKEAAKKQFLDDVDGQLKKIAEDYVVPEKGSAEFAFAYIPSEAVYYFLVTEALGMLRYYAKKGVQAVSPLTLSQKIELIKAGVQARKLSEEAEKVNESLQKLKRRFEDIDKTWLIFYKTHVKNLEGKAEELDILYKKLREEFDRIKEFTEE